jgi:DNA-binding transcriptional LysR family regulator
MPFIAFCAFPEEQAMDIRRLTHFIALAEEGRFAVAAERVHLSQAAFSRSIQTLEDRMGLKLFDRGAKGASLTPAGEVVLRRARTLVLDARNLQRDIELVRLGDVGEIIFGAAPIPAAVIVPELLCQLRRHSPRLVTRVHLGNLPTLLGQLDAQQIDFCLGDRRLVPPQARYDMAPVGRQFGALFGRPDHPLVKEGVTDADAMRRYGVALISISPALLEGLAATYGFNGAGDFPLAVECDDIGTLVHLATHTDVLAILPSAVGDSRAHALRRLPAAVVTAPFADVHAIWLKGRTLSPSAKRSIELAQAIGVASHGDPGQSSRRLSKKSSPA